MRPGSIVAQNAPASFAARTSPSKCRSSSTRRAAVATSGSNSRKASSVASTACWNGTSTWALSHRSVQVVAAQPIHPQPARLEAEEALEDPHPVTTDLQQGLDHIIGQVVGQIARGHRRGEAAQLYILVAPVAHQRLVELAEHAFVVLIDAQELAVGGLAHFGPGVDPIGFQLAPGELQVLPVDRHPERVAVGKGFRTARPAHVCR